LLPGPAAIVSEPDVVPVVSCTLCEGGRFRALATPGRCIVHEVFSALEGWLRLVRSRDCGLRFTNPRASPELTNRFYSGTTYVCHESGGSSSACPKADFLLDRICRSLPSVPRRALSSTSDAGVEGFFDTRGHEVGM
jgi:hypothetical protein